MSDTIANAVKVERVEASNAVDAADESDSATVKRAVAQPDLNGAGGGDGSVPPEIDMDGESVPQSPAQRRQAALWRLLVVGALLAFIWFLVIGLQRQNESGQRATGTAPDFEITTFAGENIRLSDLRGQGVVLNFWASWCGPCRVEADLLEAAWRREQGNGIVFIGLDYLDQTHAAQAFIAEYNITYPNGPDLQSAAARSYGIRGVPETFFIDSDGQIAHFLEGVVVTEADLNRYLDMIRPE